MFHFFIAFDPLEPKRTSLILLPHDSHILTMLSTTLVSPCPTPQAVFLTRGIMFFLHFLFSMQRATYSPTEASQLPKINPLVHVSAAAAAKSRQLCPTLCDPIDGSPPGSHPWDSPGKNTGVGCHLLLQCMKVKSESEVAQSYLTLSDPMDCSLPGSSIHGLSQSRVLEWFAIAFSEYRCLLYLNCWLVSFIYFHK